MGGESIPKIFPSANKLFTLSKYYPIGIMIYGNATFMGIPWETIIKIYRNFLSKTSFSTLEEHANDFINFLDNNSLFLNAMQEHYSQNDIRSYLIYIIEDIAANLKEIEGEFDYDTANEVVSHVIDKHYNMWEAAELAPSISEQLEETVLNEYNEIINNEIKYSFERYPLSDENLEKLKKLSVHCLLRFSDKIVHDGRSGVVIAGFGEDDIFPSLHAYYFERVVKGRIIYKLSHKYNINFETSAAVIPFAQSEMVSTFMEGVDPRYKTVKDSYIAKIFDDYAGIVVSNMDRYDEEEKKSIEEKLTSIGKQIIADLNKKLEDYRRTYHSNPVINVVAGLPKDELAAMAESLVNLTSFKRRVTPESETVGGPIDVALISKGDGFIWIKRKHYFKSELNPQFHANYYREDETDAQKE
jgi:hypothetical protein